jgi:hypothetical protein
MNPIKPVHKPGITVKEMGEEMFLYNADDKAIHILNPTAQLIWELCDGEHTIVDMEQAIRANFSVSDEHNITKDILRTLDIFADKGLLQYE